MYADAYLFLSLKAPQGIITMKCHPGKAGAWKEMQRLNLALCNSPRGEVSRLKFGICKEFTQKHSHFSARQIGGKGFSLPPTAPQWSQRGGSRSNLCLVLPQGHKRPHHATKKKETWESVPVELTRWLTYSKCRVYLQAVVVFKKLKITETSEEQRIIMIIYCL